MLPVVCALGMVLGLALPFIHLSAEPFWVDESIAVLPAQAIHEHGTPKNPFDLDFMPWQLKYELWDPATPLYRYAVAAFTWVVGFSEASTRTFSILMGALSALALYGVVRNLFDARMALVSATLFLASSTMMIFEREARHFTFVMACGTATLHYMLAAARSPGSWAAGLWPVFLVATLLSQTLGYMILPVAGAWFLLLGGFRLLAWRYWPLYVGAAAMYGAVLAAFWDTLPFFHPVDCANRFSGCQPMPEFYLKVLVEFLAPMQRLLGERSWQAISLGHLAFVSGVVFLVVEAVREPSRRRPLLLLGAWLLLPLLLLTLREVKFPRYLFIWAWPVCAVLMAAGAVWWTRRRSEGALALVVVALIAAPAVWLGGKRMDPGPALGLVHYVRNELLAPPRDDFRMQTQAGIVERVVRDRDVIVASFDDAGLGYYAGRFVHGFLNSKHDDAYFLDLVEKTRAQGGRVYYFDALRAWNFCLTADAEPTRIDCREKYERFHATCTGSLADRTATCVRVPVL
ncbi:MAG: glycosyltransferase family 39 protein [Myxococcota bacterium]|nr:glycosyltransferase family 39 protein [Myxococcota bacterium]